MKYTPLILALAAGVGWGSAAQGQSLNRQVFSAGGNSGAQLTFTLGETFAYSPGGTGQGITPGAQPGGDVVTGIGASIAAPLPSLIPNPSQGQLWLRGSAQPEDLVLLDMLGRPVLATTLEPERALSIAHLPAGTYLARIGSGSRCQTQLLVVQR